MQNYEDKIMDCFPSGNYALSALLRLADIVESKEIPTAAVECKAQPRLLLNPDFVAKYAATPEKLLMLVMHELHHVLLGHTTLFPTLTPAQNFVFDCVINSLLSRMFPVRSHTSFFTDYYSDEEFPACLLRPPRQWDGNHVPFPPQGIMQLPSLRKREIFTELYRAMYSEVGVSYDDIYRRFVKHVEGLESEIPLIGGHGISTESEAAQDIDRILIDSTKPDLPSNSPEMFEIVRQIIEQWPQPPDPIKGRSLSDLLAESDIDPNVEDKWTVQFRGLLRWVGSTIEEHGSARFKRVSNDEISSHSAIPGFARRDLILQSLGQKPLLYSQCVTTRMRIPTIDKVHVYVDVSGSMGGVLEDMYGVVRACRDFVYQKVHLFSTTVVDVSYQEFSRGKVETTYGTEIACVAKHIRENRITRACIVTDGFVGKPVGEDFQTLDKARLGVAYVDYFRDTDLARVTDRSVELAVTGD